MMRLLTQLPKIKSQVPGIWAKGCVFDDCVIVINGMITYHSGLYNYTIASAEPRLFIFIPQNSTYV